MSRRIDACARAIAEDANRGYANRGYAGRFQPIAFLLSSTLVAGLIFSGCGSDDDDAETKFGNEAELRTYRGAINPIIDAVSNIDSMVAARAYNSSGTLATADNLNEVFLEVRPQLLEVLVELDRITPPARLAALHGDIRDLIVLRLDSCTPSSWRGLQRRTNRSTRWLRKSSQRQTRSYRISTTPFATSTRLSAPHSSVASSLEHPPTHSLVQGAHLDVMPATAG